MREREGAGETANTTKTNGMAISAMINIYANYSTIDGAVTNIITDCFIQTVIL